MSKRLCESLNLEKIKNWKLLLLRVTKCNGQVNVCMSTIRWWGQCEIQWTIQQKEQKWNKKWETKKPYRNPCNSEKNEKNVDRTQLSPMWTAIGLYRFLACVYPLFSCHPFFTPSNTWLYVPYFFTTCIPRWRALSCLLCVYVCIYQYPHSVIPLHLFISHGKSHLLEIYAQSHGCATHQNVNTEWSARARERESERDKEKEPFIDVYDWIEYT